MAHPRRLTTAIPALAVVALLAALPSVGGASFGATTPPGVASYNTGRVNVILPQSLPSVELLQDANNSVSASLQVVEVLELVPGALPHPTVDAAAFPNSIHGFNGSSVANSTSWPLTLTASLAVHRQNFSLWTPVPLSPSLGVPVGAAQLSVTYAPLDNGSAGAGVGIGWTIQNWPWVSHSDLLAVEMELTVSPTGGLTICSGSAPVGLALTPCNGQSVTGAGISWGSSYNGLEGGGSSGPVAAVSWNQTTSGASAPYTVGAQSEGNGTADLVLGSAAGGSSAISGGVGFALVAPLVPSLASVVGEVPAYLATVVAATVVALLAVVGYRRRERLLNEEL